MTTNNTQTMELTVAVEATVSASNLPEFEAWFRTAVQAISLNPEGDEQLGQAEDDVKQLKAMEDSIKAVSDSIIAQAEELNLVIETTTGLGEEARKARLVLTKIIATAKDQMRKDAITQALNSIRIDKGSAVKHYIDRLRDAAKGKRTKKSLEEAVEKETILINSELADADQCIGDYRDAQGEKFVADAHELRVKTVAEIEAILNARVEQHRLIGEKEELAAKEEMARKEAEELQQAQNEMNRPPMPGGSPDLMPDAPASDGPIATVAEERAEFIRGLKEAFAPVRKLKENLVYQENKDLVSRFAKLVNADMKEVFGGGK